MKKAKETVTPEQAERIKFLAGECRRLRIRGREDFIQSEGWAEPADIIAHLEMCILLAEGWDAAGVNPNLAEQDAATLAKFYGRALGDSPTHQQTACESAAVASAPPLTTSAPLKPVVKEATPDKPAAKFEAWEDTICTYSIHAGKKMADLNDKQLVWFRDTYMNFINVKLKTKPTPEDRLMADAAREILRKRNPQA